MCSVVLVPHVWTIGRNSVSQAVLLRWNTTRYLDQVWLPGQLLATKPLGDRIKTTVEGIWWMRNVFKALIPDVSFTSPYDSIFS